MHCSCVCVATDASAPLQLEVGVSLCCGRGALAPHLRLRLIPATKQQQEEAQEAEQSVDEGAETACALALPPNRAASALSAVEQLRRPRARSRALSAPSCSRHTRITYELQKGGGGPTAECS